MCNYEVAVLIVPQELEIHPVVISKDYAPGQLDFQGAEFHQLTPLHVEAVARLSGLADIRVKGHLATKLAASCDRCVGPVEIDVNRDFDLLYWPMSSIARDEEIEISRDDLDVGFYPGPGVELRDVLTEQVILSVPMKVICSPDCRGLCPVCGANRNLEACHCPMPSVDSPFSSLKLQG
jgi:uncharacterized protein